MTKYLTKFTKIKHEAKRKQLKLWFLNSETVLSNHQHQFSQQNHNKIQKKVAEPLRDTNTQL
jgi:hypothetical protein